MLAIFLQLGALVGGESILQGQFVQAQFLTQTLEQIRPRLLQLYPEEHVRACAMIADLVERNFPALRGIGGIQKTKHLGRLHGGHDSAGQK